MKAEVRPLIPRGIKDAKREDRAVFQDDGEKGFPGASDTYALWMKATLPFLFIPAPNHNFLNSTFSNNEKHIRSWRKRRKLHMNDGGCCVAWISGETLRVFGISGEVRS